MHRLEWRGTFLWFGDKLLASLRLEQSAVRLDLRGWDGFGLCDHPYASRETAKRAAEAWARSRGITLALASRPDAAECPRPIDDDDIPF